MVFYLRRIAFYLVTLWAAISLNFLLPRMMPGDPAAIMIGKLRRASGGRELSEETVKAIYALLGADRSVPAWDQYLAYWGRLLSGDLGISSTRYPYPVATLIGNALPWTLAETDSGLPGRGRGLKSPRNLPPPGPEGRVGYLAWPAPRAGAAGARRLKLSKINCSKPLR